MKQLVPLCVLLVAGFSAFACGSSDSGNTGAACAPSAYQSQSTPACTSCVESKCSSQYQALCDANCAAQSGSTLSSACQSALQGVGECADSNCPVCVPASNGSAGADSGAAGVPATGVGRACTIGTDITKICNWYPAGTGLTTAQIDSICTNSNGVAADHCSNDGLAGCCLKGNSGGLCYYQATNAQDYKDACDAGSGTFTSTAP